MRILAALLAVILGGCIKPSEPKSAFLDPTFAAMIPADSNLLVGINVEQLVKTPVYQQFLAAGRLKIVEELSQRMGLNPAKDLWQVLLVSNGKQSYWLGRGNFSDPLMAPDFSKPGIRRFGYKGATIFGDENRALMMFNSSTVALGETNILRALADARPNIKAPPADAMALVNQIPHGAHVWGVWTGGDFALPMQGNLANAQRMLKSISQATLYLDLTQNVHGQALATASSDASAQDVAGALDALLAIGRMSPKTAALAQGIQSSRNGREITLKFDAPPELAALLFN